jgi:DUF1680 family protein
MNLIYLALFLGVLGAGIAMGGTTSLTPVPFTDVKVEDAFWAPRIKTNRETVLPHCFKHCEDTGRISNFLKAAGKMEGDFKGIFFDDSDVYKVLEGAAYSLAHQRDPELEKIADEVIDKICAAQLPDGYLYCFYTVKKQLDKRWTDEKQMHETYCAGHMIEAAIAYFQATGKRKFLDTVIKFADHIDSVFGPDKKHDAPGHEEIELALIKLYHLTKQEKYLKLARFFIEERGRGAENKRTIQGDYSQDHVPVRKQREIVGHAVRAMYLYCAVADSAAIDGDPEYIATMDAIWHDVVDRKMYITGGIGPSAHNEGFTVPYDLPNETAYCETCASIGMALWNHRLNLLHADGKYADVVERAMYNGLVSGVSLDGQKFFYVNPLASKGRHHRQAWFGCACCPTNVVRYLPTVGGYAYAQRDQSVFVNHYIAGSGKVALGGNTVTLKQETKYPWDGAVKITVALQQPAAFELCLRIPGWCDGASLKVNGQAAELAKDNGYAKVKREWKSGDVVELDLPMPVRRVYADPNVKADVGRVAIQRGPVVYCLEGADNAASLRALCLPKDVKLTAEHRGDLLNGVTVIKGAAQSLARKPAGQTGLDTQSFEFVAVPYYAWDNRTAGEMIVWLAEDPAVAQPKPLPTIASESKATASHCHSKDGMDALNDQFEPANSGDHGVPRFTWWDHKGTTEWVQYDFKAPQKLSAAEVYWFDDTGRGQCRVPQSWKLLYKDGAQWKPMENPSEYGIKKDAYNRVTFAPVETSALRIEVQLQPNMSGGVLEWKVE